MKITVDTKSPTEIRVDLLVVAMPKLSGRLPTRLAAIDRALKGQISAVIDSEDFAGNSGETQMLYSGGKIPATRVQLVGLGKEEDLDANAYRSAAGRAVNVARAKNAAKIAVVAARSRKVPLETAVQAMAEGAVLAGYRFDSYRQPDKKKSGGAAAVTLLLDRSGDLRAGRGAARTGTVLAESQNVARRLSDEPPNLLPPLELARSAQRVAREVGLGVKIMREPELKRRGMGGILAVGGGSSRPPCLVVLEHDPRPSRSRSAVKAGKSGSARKSRRPTVCLVGKGITFDSGGISIKPSGAMDEMKHDMSGAATVVGAMRAVALLKLPIRVVGVIAAAENLPSSTAYRPGDIVTTLSKKTVEVLNTDAEGRVVLADALHYARTEYQPEAMVDLATLTGACVVALGKWATGMFANHQKLADAIHDAGEASAERAWQLPLWDEHRKAVRSSVADIKNTTGRDASSSTAAAFLQNFVGETPWVHLDIAGTAWGSSPAPYLSKGATGVGVRLLLELLRTWKERRVV
jgi:leucyl aminopeptidase